MLVVRVDDRLAWCSVVGAFIANLFLGGLAKSYGLIMEAFREVFQSGTVYLLLAALANHYISLRCGNRIIVVVGAFGTCISLLAAAFAPTLFIWVMAVGVGMGSFLSPVFFSIFAVTGKCFRRYLGLANGISVTGVSFGQILFPFLIIHLNETYGARGGTIIIAAISLHLLITAILIPSDVIDPDARPIAVKAKQKTFNQQKELNPVDPSCEQLLKDPVDSDMELSTLVAPSMAVVNEFSNYESRSTLNRQFSDKKSHFQSMASIKSESHVQRNMIRLCRSLLLVYIAGKIFSDLCDVSISFLLPAHGTHLGLDDVMISRAIGAAGVLDLITRISIGWFTDRPAFVGRRGVMLAVTWIVQGLNAYVLSELDRLKITNAADDLESSVPASTTLVVLYFICVAVHGACSGSSITLMIVVLSDWVGTDKLAHYFAIALVILGLVISPGQLLIGFIADWTSNEVWPMRICSVALVFSGLVLFLEFPVRRLHSNCHTEPTHDLIEKSVNGDWRVERSVSDINVALHTNTKAKSDNEKHSNHITDSKTFHANGDTFH